MDVVDLNPIVQVGLSNETILDLFIFFDPFQNILLDLEAIWIHVRKNCFPGFCHETETLKSSDSLLVEFGPVAVWISGADSLPND